MMTFKYTQDHCSYCYIRNPCYSLLLESVFLAPFSRYQLSSVYMIYVTVCVWPWEVLHVEQNKPCVLSDILSISLSFLTPSRPTHYSTCTLCCLSCCYFRDIYISLIHFQQLFKNTHKCRQKQHILTVIILKTIPLHTTTTIYATCHYTVSVPSVLWHCCLVHCHYLQPQQTMSLHSTRPSLPRLQPVTAYSV